MIINVIYGLWEFFCTSSWVDIYRSRDRVEMKSFIRFQLVNFISTMLSSKRVFLGFLFKIEIHDCFFSFWYSPSVLNLIKDLLVVDPNKRISAIEALNHQWFTDVEKITGEKKGIDQSVITRLQSFKG